VGRLVSGPLALADGIALVGHHVDALELSCSIDVVPMRLATRLEELDCQLDAYRRRARATTPAHHVQTKWTWANEPVIAHPSGLRPGKRYCLESRDWMLFVSAAPFGPRLVIQLRSEFLLSAGPLPAFEQLRTWTESNLLSLANLIPDTEPRWNIARLDLAADIAGVVLTPSDLPLFTTRAVARRAFSSEQDVVTESQATTHYRGRVLTGYTFGKRGAPSHARIYDKTREASSDAPARTLWTANGYDPDRHGKQIWRVEFEVRSGLLYTLATTGGKHLPTSRPEDILRSHLDDIWHHLTTRWLVLHTGSHARPDRSPVAPWWSSLSILGGLDADEGVPLTELVRRPREPLDATVFLKQAAGLLVCFAAANGSPSMEAALGALRSWATANLAQEEFARRVRMRSRRFAPKFAAAPPAAKSD